MMSPPHILAKSKSYDEGRISGYLVSDNNGNPITIKAGKQKYASLKLEDDFAREWCKGFLLKRLKLGLDGWSADLMFTSPHSDDAFKNESVLLWAKLNRELFDQEKPKGDCLLFTSTGYTGIQKYSSIMFADKMSYNSKKETGLSGPLNSILSAGISGVPVVSSEIEEYKCGEESIRQKNLFLRKLQMGAFLPIMAFEKGIEKCGPENQDDELKDAIKKYSELHTLLFPYIYTAVHESSMNGRPVIRHLFLHYPDDPKVYDIEDEFLVGDRILVAPVMEENEDSRKVYLPKGSWIDFWTGERLDGGARYTIDTPPDHIPVFVKEGTILPMFDTEIDTLDVETRKDIVGWDDANKSMTVNFYGRGQAGTTLYDGTKILCDVSPLKNMNEGLFFDFSGELADPPYNRRDFGAEGMTVSLKGTHVEQAFINNQLELAAKCRIEGFVNRTYTLKFISP